MKIALLEPFMGGSHAAWAEEYAACSRHDVTVYSLPGRHWKWRMHGGAVSLARDFLAQGKCPDLLLASDMLDLSGFLALTREVTAAIPAALYFHENQLTYPWSPTDQDLCRKRNAHYAFINYTSALAADAVLFNSAYHRQSFLHELPLFLRGFPDRPELDRVAEITVKSTVLPLGLDLCRFDRCRPISGPQPGWPPLLLWNHRWEYDKNPQAFFTALFRLAERGIAFRLAVLGESYRTCPPIFAAARQRLAGQIVHWGYADSFADYAAWLWRADILPVTSWHDFFGASVVQAIYCGCLPLLPQRLAYPEHVEKGRYPECFYADEDQFVERLEELCKKGLPDISESLRKGVAGYDWQRLGPEYDRKLEKISCATLAFRGQSG
jgi:glycosyltransferase involved in cell wall biosynthesis